MVLCPLGRRRQRKMSARQSERDNARRKRYQVMMSDDENAAVTSAAGKAHRSRSEFMLLAALDAAAARGCHVGASPAPQAAPAAPRKRRAR